MRHPFEAWRRRLRLWTVPLVFFAINLAGFVVYQTTFSGNVDTLQEIVEAAAKDREAIAEERRDSIAFLERVAERRQAVERLYDDYFSTETERLTRVIREAKSLARQAGLTPRTINYPEEPFGDQGLVQQKIVFPVEGTYEELRRFVNFLELSEQFLTLEMVSFNENRTEGTNPVLAIQLELSTVFVEPDAGPRRPRAGGAS